MTQPEFSFSEVHPSVKGMVRHHDHDTSIESAQSISARDLSALHHNVLLAFKAHGPMNDEKLERLPEFLQFGPSTIRKRRSELFQQGKLCIVGKNLNSAHKSMKVWDIL